MQEPAPGNMAQLKVAIEICLNLIYLLKWVPDDQWSVLARFQEYFWSSVETFQRDGYVLTVGDITSQWMRYQRHWRKQAVGTTTFAQAVTASVPEDDGEEDVHNSWHKMRADKAKGASSPSSTTGRTAPATQQSTQNRPATSGTDSAATRTIQQRLEEETRKRKEANKRADALQRAAKQQRGSNTNAGGSSEPAPARERVWGGKSKSRGGGKGKSKGKSKSKSKSKSKTKSKRGGAGRGGGRGNGNANSQQSNSNPDQPAKCWYHANGGCHKGEDCPFSHD